MVDDAALVGRSNGPGPAAPSARAPAGAPRPRAAASRVVAQRGGRRSSGARSSTSAPAAASPGWCSPRTGPKPRWLLVDAGGVGPPTCSLAVQELGLVEPRRGPRRPGRGPGPRAGPPRGRRSGDRPELRGARRDRGDRHRPGRGRAVGVVVSEPPGSRRPTAGREAGLAPGSGSARPRSQVVGGGTYAALPKRAAAPAELPRPDATPRQTPGLVAAARVRSTPPIVDVPRGTSDAIRARHVRRSTSRAIVPRGTRASVQRRVRANIRARGPVGGSTGSGGKMAADDAERRGQRRWFRILGSPRGGGSRR